MCLFCGGRAEEAPSSWRGIPRVQDDIAATQTGSNAGGLCRAQLRLTHARPPARMHARALSMMCTSVGVTPNRNIRYTEAFSHADNFLL